MYHSCLIVVKALSAPLALALTMSLYPGHLSASEPLPFASLEGWEERSFSGHTRYALATLEGVKVLHASTDGAASVLYRQQRVDISSTPWLQWHWRIGAPYDIANERIREGDDFAARVYVVARRGPLPWQTLALNYVWSSREAVGAHWPNPFTNKAHMIVLEQGQASGWRSVSRNVREDFKRYFGKDVDEIAGFAVMVDGDNSGAQGEAWFGALNFVAPAAQ